MKTGFRYRVSWQYPVLSFGLRVTVFSVTGLYSVQSTCIIVNPSCVTVLSMTGLYTMGISLNPASVHVFSMTGLYSVYRVLVLVWTPPVQLYSLWRDCTVYSVQSTCISVNPACVTIFSMTELYSMQCALYLY